MVAIFGQKSESAAPRLVGVMCHTDGFFASYSLYEFIQRRADWKKIERTVDKAMYAISVKEDCVVM